MFELKPRQLPASGAAAKQQQPAQQNGPQSLQQIGQKNAPAPAADDSDDEEFEQRLGSATQGHALGGGDGEKEDETEQQQLPMEGPPRPSRLANGSSNVGGGAVIGQQQRTKATAEAEKPRILVDRPLIDYGTDSEEGEAEEASQEDDGGVGKRALPVDFFGLTSAPVKRPRFGEGLPMEEGEEPPIFIDDVAPGPARPSMPLPDQSMEQDDGQMLVGPSNATPIRSITDQEAGRIIYERDLAPFGVSSTMASCAVSDMIDVSVDAALGPDIRQNLLRNLDNKKMAQIALGPLPKLKKNEADRLAKRKHQITHLATVAVSREEQLQEKWAEGKQNKKMSRQKYGF